MIPILNVPKRARKPAKPVVRYPVTFYQQQFGPVSHSDLPLLLPERFDPAFLRYQDSIPVYCTELVVDIIQNEIAGITRENALVDLYLLIDTYPEGRRPLTD